MAKQSRKQRLKYTWDDAFRIPEGRNMWSSPVSERGEAVKDRVTMAKFLKTYGQDNSPAYSSGPFRKRVIQPGKMWSIQWPTGERVFLMLEDVCSSG